MTRILSLLLILFPLTLFAQSEEEHYKHEVGVNIASSLKPGSQRFPAIDYKYFYVPHRAFRIQLGFDGTVGRNDGEVETENAFFFPGGRTDTVSSSGPNETSDMNLRIGHIWFKDLSSRARLYAGADFYWGLSKSIFRYNHTVKQVFQPNNVTTIRYDSKTKERKETLGISPILGIQYELTERITVGLTTSIGFYQITTQTDRSIKQEQENSFNPEVITQRNQFTGDTKDVDFRLDPFTGLVVAVRLKG